VQLDDITVTVRPRSHREAMDLGMRLFQTHWRALYPPLLIVVLPLLLLIVTLLSDYMFFALLLVWWLKPLYDRILLHVYSHALFGQIPSTAQTLSALLGLLKNGLWLHLSLLRLSPNRSFLLPVWQLENLRGQARKERSRVLAARASGHSLWLWFFCFSLELLLLFCFYSIIMIFLPASSEISQVQPLFVDDPAYWTKLLFVLLYQMAMLLVEPYYVAAGFMLYINRRTELEAWDIEISFRRLTQRIKALSSAAVLILVVMLSPLVPQSAQAASEPETKIDTAQTPKDTQQVRDADESRTEIDEVLANKDFNTSKKITRRKLKGFNFDLREFFERLFKDKEKPEEPANSSFFDTLRALFSGLAALFAGGFKLIILLLLAALVVYFIATRKGWLSGLKRRKKHPKAEIPTTLFGMDIQPESLPKNISQAASRLWHQGQHREALGLLYRGSLSRLVNHDALLLNDAMTENDVLNCARSARLAAERVEYLAQLTVIWQVLAYGHRQPADARANELFEHWSRHFDSPQAGNKVTTP